MNTGLRNILAPLTGGLLIGLGAGVSASVLLFDDDNDAPDTVVETMSSASPIPMVRLPEEDEDWDPCAKPGLCPILESLNGALGRGDSGAVLGLVRWTTIDCHQTPPADAAYTVTSPDCTYWPASEPLPTVELGLLGSESFAAGPEHMRATLGEFMRDNQVCQGRPASVGVVAITLPVDEDSFLGERNALIGLPLQCKGSIERYLVGLVRTDADGWRIETFTRAGGLGLLPSVDPPYRSDLISKFRYYPVD